jgi:release factor glutamine methyltransferase
VLGWDRARLLTDGDSVVPSAERERFRWLVGMRATRRPLQHLIGTQAFWRHEFLVTPDVLIPRPETEILVEAALQRLASVPKPRVADVGTGSGCIALSVAAEIPAAEVHAVDVSEAALVVARENAARLGLAARVQFHRGDLLAPVRGLRFDAILSNPPYVDRATAGELAPEVRDHEPALALFPAGDAYAIYRRLIPEAALCLVPGGLLLLEVGQGMADTVAGLCSSAGVEVESVLEDLQGIPRTVVARASPG